MNKINQTASRFWGTIPSTCLLLLAAIAFPPSTTTAQETISVTINTQPHQPLISRYIYGHFSEDLGRCIYDGFWVDSTLAVPQNNRLRLDVIEALKKINIPVLRWPGGCFADQYHWRDGIGPQNQRTHTVNTTWGMVPDDNSFGTHEFLELCSLLHCEPYIAGNVGSGTPAEMENWLEYLNYNGLSTLTDIRKKNGRAQPWNVSFWGVGNESWGCGGNMTPEFYSDQYKKYSAFAKDYPGAPLKLIASGANGGDLHWTETLMKNLTREKIWGISLHYYTLAGDWDHKGSATGFTDQQYFTALKNGLAMNDLIGKNEAIMNQYDPNKKIALVVDEWGIWTDVEPGTHPAFLYQQNSLRDALIAASTLNIFNNHCERVKMANLAQTVNVLQALILTNKEKMLLTPTYYVFDLYKYHQDAQLLAVNFKSPSYSRNGDSLPALNISASRDSLGVIHVTIVNIDPSKKINVQAILAGTEKKSALATIIQSSKTTDINTFDQPFSIRPQSYSHFKKNQAELLVEMPPASIVLVELK